MIDFITVDDHDQYGIRLGSILMQKYYLKFNTARILMSVYQCTSEAEFLLHLTQATVGILSFPIG